MEELSSILSNLCLSENKETFLGELKPSLSSLHRADIAANINSVDLVALFDCLNTDKPRQIEACCDVLRFLLAFMDPVIILQKYGEFLRIGLGHTNPLVPLLVIKQLQRFAGDEELAAMIGNHPIYLEVLEHIKDELIVAEAVSEFVFQLSETKAGMRIVLGNPSVAVVQQMSNINETIKIRILQTAVKISQLSEEHLAEVDRVGLLQPLLDLLHVKDILVRLNAVELVTSIALTHQGLRYLESHSVIYKMEEILKETRSDPFADVLVPGLIKFFGNIAHLRPKQMILQHPEFLNTLFEMAESADRCQQAVAFETLGYIGESLEGKSTLSNLGNKFINCIEKLENLIRDSPTEFRIRGLNALASLIKLEKENQTAEYLQLTESWLRSALGSRGDPLQVLVGILKQPFPDLRLAVYQVLVNMGRQAWGRSQILRTPGLPELLLDRAAERDKDGKDARYSLIQCLVESGDAKDIVGHALDILLREYVRLGPYYVQVQSSVAYEEQN